MATLLNHSTFSPSASDVYETAYTAPANNADTTLVMQVGLTNTDQYESIAASMRFGGEVLVRNLEIPAGATIYANPTGLPFPLNLGESIEVETDDHSSLVTHIWKIDRT